MQFYSLYVPYANQYIEKNISEEDAFSLQEKVINARGVVTWVLYHRASEREFEKETQEKTLD